MPTLAAGQEKIISVNDPGQVTLTPGGGGSITILSRDSSDDLPVPRSITSAETISMLAFSTLHFRAVGADATYVIQSPVSGGVVDVSAADVNNDVAPASPGEYPNSLTRYIVPAGGGPAPGFRLVWIPPTHASLPALRGWRYEFAPSETVV